MILYGFPLLTVVFFALLIRELRNGVRRSTLGDNQKKRISTTLIVAPIGWAIAVSFWSLSGIMSDFSRFPLNVMPVFVIPLATILLFTFQKSTRQILDAIPAARLIRLQSFRIFVELLLWAMYIQEIAPVQMTFEGRNFDVLSGITSVFAAYYAARPNPSRTVLVIWNLACLGLLINIVAVAVLSMPGPFRFFMNEPSNTIVTHFPAVFLPAFLVPLAYLLHFLSLRQLFRSPQKTL